MCLNGSDSSSLNDDKNSKLFKSFLIQSSKELLKSNVINWLEIFVREAPRLKVCLIYFLSNQNDLVQV